MSAGVFAEEMFRARPHKVRLQLLRANDLLPVTEALTTFMHRLMAKASHLDPDAAAIFDLTSGFENIDLVQKIVEGTIPASATDVVAVPVGRTTRLYLQWQTTDGANVKWIVASGSLIVRSSLPRTA